MQFEPIDGTSRAAHLGLRLDRGWTLGLVAALSAGVDAAAQLSAPYEPSDGSFASLEATGAFILCPAATLAIGLTAWTGLLL